MSNTKKVFVCSIQVSHLNVNSLKTEHFGIVANSLEEAKYLIQIRGSNPNEYDIEEVNLTKSYVFLECD